MELNWYAGWILLLCAFLSGAAVGLFFHREEFWGGYGSFRRRVARLGHVAFAALGMLNLIFYGVAPAGASPVLGYASILLAIGGATMGPLCLLTAWRSSFRHLFFIPVTALTGGVVLVLAGGIP